MKKVLTYKQFVFLAYFSVTVLISTILFTVFYLSI